MPERWKAILGYDNYEVSNEGRVRSLPRLAPCGSGNYRSVRGGLLKLGRHHGYHVVRLSNNDKIRRTHFVHVLVCEAFHGSRPAGMEVRHLNGDRENNRVENLRWGTRAENSLDQVTHGTHHWANKTHCPKGHSYTPENTEVRYGTKRRCLACRREAARNYWAKRGSQRRVELRKSNSEVNR